MEWDENLLVVIPCGSKARLRYHANKWNALSNVWLADLRVKYASELSWIECLATNEEDMGSNPIVCIL